MPVDAAISPGNKLLDKLRAKQADYGKKIEAGIKRAALHLQRASQKVVPVLSGNLKASSFTRSEGKGLSVKAHVGYTAAYAVYVHENLDAAHGSEFNAKHADKIAGHQGRNTKSKHAYWFNRGPNQRAKFLEGPMNEERPAMAALIRDSVK